MIQKNKKTISMIFIYLILLLPFSGFVYADDIEKIGLDIERSENRITGNVIIEENITTDAAQACIDKYERTENFVEVLENDVIEKMTQTAELMMAVATITNSIDSILKKLEVVIGDDECCNMVPFFDVCHSLADVNRAWDKIYFPYLRPLSCLITCGWCSREGRCGGIISNFEEGQKWMQDWTEAGLEKLTLGWDDAKNWMMNNILFDPFGNIYGAVFCLCPTAILLHMKKIRVMYKSHACCIKNVCENGGSTEACDEQLDEAICHYTEGFIWKRIGSMIKDTIMKAIHGLLLDTVYIPIRDYINSMGFGSLKLSQCWLKFWDLRHLKGLTINIIDSAKFMTEAYEPLTCANLGANVPVSRYNQPPIDYRVLTKEGYILNKNLSNEDIEVYDFTGKSDALKGTQLVIEYADSFGMKVIDKMSYEKNRYNNNGKITGYQRYTYISGDMTTYRQNIPPYRSDDWKLISSKDGTRYYEHKKNKDKNLKIGYDEEGYPFTEYEYSDKYGVKYIKKSSKDTNYAELDLRKKGREYWQIDQGPRTELKDDHTTLYYNHDTDETFVYIYKTDEKKELEEVEYYNENKKEKQKYDVGDFWKLSSLERIITRKIERENYRNGKLMSTDRVDDIPEIPVVWSKKPKVIENKDGTKTEIFDGVKLGKHVEEKVDYDKDGNVISISTQNVVNGKIIERNIDIKNKEIDSVKVEGKEIESKKLGIIGYYANKFHLITNQERRDIARGIRANEWDTYGGAGAALAAYGVDYLLEDTLDPVEDFLYELRCTDEWYSSETTEEPVNVHSVEPEETENKDDETKEKKIENCRSYSGTLATGQLLLEKREQGKNFYRYSFEIRPCSQDIDYRIYLSGDVHIDIEKGSMAYDSVRVKNGEIITSSELDQICIDTSDRSIGNFGVVCFP